MDCIEEDLRRAGVTKCGRTAGRQRMTLNDITADRQQWRNPTADQWLKSAGQWTPELTWLRFDGCSTSFDCFSQWNDGRNAIKSKSNRSCYWRITSRLVPTANYAACDSGSGSSNSPKRFSRTQRRHVRQRNWRQCERKCDAVTLRANPPRQLLRAITPYHTVEMPTDATLPNR